MSMFHNLKATERYWLVPWIGVPAISCLVYTGSQTYGIDYIKRAFLMYKDGYEVPFDGELKERCLKLQKLANIPKVAKEEGDIQFFYTPGDEPFSYGSVHNSYAAGLVGIPYFLTYKKVEDVDKRSICFFHDQSIPWDSKAGQRLLDSFVLTDRAKDFLILRQIYMLDNMKVMFVPGIALGVLTALRIITNFFNNKPQYKAVSLPMRIQFKTFIFTLGIGFFILFRNALHSHYQKVADTKAVAHGDDFFEGAIEYYSNMIKMNKALRKMMGKDGESYFSKDGDQFQDWIGFLFRPAPLPLSERIRLINDFKSFHYDPEEE